MRLERHFSCGWFLVTQIHRACGSHLLTHLTCAVDPGITPLGQSCLYLFAFFVSLWDVFLTNCSRIKEIWTTPATNLLFEIYSER